MEISIAGSLIQLLAGSAPLTGFVLLGSYHYVVHPSKGGAQDITVHVYVKQ